jgi:leader peptidase (prepilin peptidase)/N-methyltransferase
MIKFFVAGYAFLVGSMFGSFLNVCIARWPRDLSIVRPRSRCPHCGHQLAWFENIPLLSWMVLRARCRCCDESISVQYPFVELVVALWWMWSVMQFGPSLLALRLAVFGTILLGVAVTDWQHYLIPDGFTVFGLFWTLATSLAGLFLFEQGPFVDPLEAIVGACAGAGLVAIIGWLGEVALKKEAMGMGDVTLMAFAGAALGPTRAILTVFLGAMLGAVAFPLIIYPLSRMKRAVPHDQTELALGSSAFQMPLVPFGVFLAPAALATLLWGDAVRAWLLRG